jgi:antitoxin (DNA-binding transcriptional repressor) of toxin-antitoxin stability system
MNRVELSAEQQAALHLQAALQQVADGRPIILTAEGVELAALIPMKDLDRHAQGRGRPEEANAILADFLKGHVGLLHSSEYIPGGARLSEDSGRKFAAGLAAKYQQKRS